MTDLFSWMLAANSGLHVFDFLSNSILKEVLSSLQKGKPGAFSPGKPTEFLANYKSSLKFLGFLEGIKKFVTVFTICCAVIGNSLSSISGSSVLRILPHVFRALSFTDCSRCFSNNSCIYRFY